MKKLSYGQNLLVSAICLGLCPFAAGGYVGLLWWLNTNNAKTTWGFVTVLIVYIVAMMLCLIPLLFQIVAVYNLLQRHRAIARAKVASTQAQTTTPPEEFFAAHRQEMMAVNELILADAALQRPPECFFYCWNSMDQALRATVYPSWPTELTAEQQEILDSLGNGHFFNIELTPDSIKYTFDRLRPFIYVLQYSGSIDHLQHLDGKWYYNHNDDTERESL